MDTTSAAIGNPFFVTERVAGTADMSLLRRASDDPEARGIAIDLATAAARLHQVDWRPLGVGDFLPVVTIADTAPTQIAYWEELFRRQRLEPLPVAVFAFDWLHDHLPPTDRVSIVHGDLRFGNLLYDGGRISALLDWEMVHLGDPIEDLAWAYRSLWSLEKFLPVDEFLARYTDLTGYTVTADHFLYWRLFNEVKHSIISLTAAIVRRRAHAQHPSRRSRDDGHHVPLTIHGVVAMINPSISKLLSGVATSLDETVLPELAPGFARNQLVAAIALVRRAAAVDERIGSYLWEDNRDIAAVLTEVAPWSVSTRRQPPSTPGIRHSTNCASRTSSCNINWSPCTTRCARTRAAIEHRPRSACCSQGCSPASRRSTPRPGSESERLTRRIRHRSGSDAANGAHPAGSRDGRAATPSCPTR